MKRIIEIWTLLLVFFLPWQTRWIIEANKINGISNEYLTFSLYLVDVLIVGLLLIKITNLIVSKKTNFPKNNFWKRKSFLLLVFFVFLNGASVLWAENGLLALQHFAWILLATGLAWIVRDYMDKAQVAFWFLTGLTISAWLGIWQVLTQFAFANKWLGLAQHDPILSGVSVIEFYVNGKAIRFLRAYGNFDNPNIFGVMMVIGILLSAWILVEIEKREIRKNILFVILVSFSSGLFFSFSRSAWAGLLLGLLFIFIKLFKQSENKKINNLIKPILVVGLVFVFLIFLYPAQFQMRSNGNGRLEQRSITDRQLYFEQGKKIIAKNWLLGIGAGNYIETLKRNNSAMQEWNYQPVHNILLLIWAELGIAGVLLVFFLLIIGLFGAWHFDVFGLGLIISMIPSAMFDHWLWSLHFGVLGVGFLIGLILNHNNKVKI